MTIDTASFLLGSTAAFAVSILDRAVQTVLARRRLKKLLAAMPPAPVPIRPEDFSSLLSNVPPYRPEDERVTPVSPE